VSGDPQKVGGGALESIRSARARAATRAPVPYDEHEDSDTMAEHAAAMAAANRRLRWEQVCPRRFLEVSMAWVADQHGQQVHDRLVAWSLLSPTPNLLLLGPVGTGKSGTSLAACKEGQMDRGEGVLFLPVTELLDQLRPGGPDGALERLCQAPRLIVDDLGSEKPTDWTAERLGVLVNRRWLEELPTIATSNLPATRKSAPADFAGSTLEEVLGERTFSRLVGGAVVLELSGADRRRQRG
jgi:DNA replication protein DnaC